METKRDVVNSGAQGGEPRLEEGDLALLLGSRHVRSMFYSALGGNDPHGPTKPLAPRVAGSAAESSRPGPGGASLP